MLVWIRTHDDLQFQRQLGCPLDHGRSLKYQTFSIAYSLESFENFQHDERGLFELKLGGAVYAAGVVFFKCDGRIPLAHAIWHLFVLAGSMIHYFAVLEHLYGAGSQPQAVLVNVEMSGPKILHSEF